MPEQAQRLRACRRGHEEATIVGGHSNELLQLLLNIALTQPDGEEARQHHKRDGTSLAHDSFDASEAGGSARVLDPHNLRQVRVSRGLR